jgi:hypothetical protein
LYTYAPTFELEVDTAVQILFNLAKIWFNYQTTKIHNPWLEEEFLNNKSRKNIQYELPKKDYTK